MGTLMCFVSDIQGVGKQHLQQDFIEALCDGGTSNLNGVADRLSDEEGAIWRHTLTLTPMK